MAPRVTNADLKGILDEVKTELGKMNGRQRDDHDDIQKVKTIQEKCPVVNQGWSLHNPRVLLMLVAMINGVVGLGIVVAQK